MSSATGLIFLPATEADLPALLALRKQTMDPHLRAADLPVDDACHMLRVRYQWEHARLIMLEGQWAGLFKAYRDAACWQLVQLQIAPPFQGRGLGARVLAGMLAQADAQALPACLSVLKPNPARHLYERCGFRIVGEEGQEYLMRREPGAV